MGKAIFSIQVYCKFVPIFIFLLNGLRCQVLACTKKWTGVDVNKRGWVIKVKGVL